MAAADASHSKDGSPLWLTIGFMTGSVKKRSRFFFLPLVLHRSRCPAQSLPAVEIIASSKAVDEVVPLKETLKKVVELEDRFRVILKCKDLYHALWFKQNTVHKSVRSDGNSMLFYFIMSFVVFAWIQGALRLAVSTKMDSAVTEMLVFTLATVDLQIVLTGCEITSWDWSLRGWLTLEMD